MVVQIKSGKRENGKSFWDNLYRKRSTGIRSGLRNVDVEEDGNHPNLGQSCRANSAHLRQSRPDSGLGLQAEVLQTI